MGILVLTQPQPPQPFADALAKVLPQEPVFLDRDTARASEVDAIVLWRLTPGLLAPFKAVKFLAASAAGVDKILGSNLPPGLPVTRTVDPEQNLQIAQYVCAMVLRHLRQLSLYDSQQGERIWKRHPVARSSENTIGVLGLGESGKVTAAALTAMGFPVAGWSRSPKSLPGVTSFHGADGLAQMLPRCRVVVCMLPLTPDTAGIVDAKFLAMLPPGAFVINVARGAHLVEPDLCAALHNGHLSGAALDVQSQEPLPVDDPLWETPRLWITPHVASLPSPEAVATQLAENLQRARNGEPLLRVVDVNRGY